MEAQKLSGLIDESNGKKTIWQQFDGIRVSIKNILLSIQNLHVRMIAVEAAVMEKEKRNG
jgi:hypothetical protein